MALGGAAAVKVYPMLLLGWIALRGQWRAFASGADVAVGVGVARVLFRGVNGFLDDRTDWSDLAGGGWPTRRANQSLVAMWGRYLLGEGPAGYPTLAFEEPAALWLAGLVVVTIIGPLALAGGGTGLRTIAWSREMVASTRCPCSSLRSRGNTIGSHSFLYSWHLETSLVVQQRIAYRSVC